MANYCALIHKDPDSDYGVSFPDFPGCVTAGKSIDDAKELAQEALLGHVRVMQKFGEKVPEPSNLEKIVSSSEGSGVIAFFIVTIQSQKPKKIRVNITLPEDDLLQIDIFAKRYGMTRSAFLLRAAKEIIHTQSHS